MSKQETIKHGKEQSVGQGRRRNELAGANDDLEAVGVMKLAVIVIVMGVIVPFGITEL